MEGISSEAASLAGTWKLGKLIILYDSNHITIEGDTSIAFREDVASKYKAMGFQILRVSDANNLEEISEAIEKAKLDKEHPSLIIVNSIIGYGCPAKQGTSSIHGDPIGLDNIKETRRALEWDDEEPFFVPPSVYAHYKKLAIKGAKKEDLWNKLMEKYACLLYTSRCV